MSSASDPSSQPTGDIRPPNPAVTGDFSSLDERPSHRDVLGTPQAGGMIGPYRLLERIGEGGFGEVWLAERREPMVQRVALKVIKPGMDSRSVVARFEQERQALAVMNHPNVARVLDGGLTALGRPYFVMEYVKGDPITGFCDRQRLTIRERLALFLPVCEALQHAHMKGIIHRDIKPTNILVAPGEGGGAPTVKVIDFGVAKAMSSPLTDATIHTERGQMIGTPEYMSPEQAEMGATDIDTRSDVYSLGVVLYELLSGTLPFDSKTLRTGGYSEMQRLLVETEPPRPSARLSSIDDAEAAAIARARQSQRDRIAIELRSELEWVPLKAMRKDRARRYSSAESLAADVRRYLAGQPLEAAPESRAYLVRKFVRRNRVQVSAAALVVIVLVAGLVATLWQARVAARERDAAQRAEQAAVAAQEAERRRADELTEVSQFQSAMLKEISPTAAGADLMKDVRNRFDRALVKEGVADAERLAQSDQFGEMLGRVNATDAAAAMIDRTILRPAVASIERQFKDQPLVEAQLRWAVAGIYHQIGLFDDSLALHQAALATRRRELGDDAPLTRLSISEVGSVLGQLGRLDEAETYHLEALERCRRVLGEDNRETIVAMQDLGFLRRTQGKFAEAEASSREALARARRVMGDDAQDTLIAIGNLAGLLREQNKFAEAEPLFREALERNRRIFGEDHPETIRAVSNLGVLLFTQRRLAEAEPLYREGLEKSRRVFGEEHPDTLSGLANMGSLLVGMKKPAEAEVYLREAFEVGQRIHGRTHRKPLMTLVSLVFLLRSEGRYQEAIDLIVPLEAAVRKSFTGSNEYIVGAVLTSLGRSRVGLGYDAGRFELAEKNLLEAYPLLAKTFGETHNNTLGTVEGLADLYAAWATAEPGKGYDEKAGAWRAKLDAAKAK